MRPKLTYSTREIENTEAKMISPSQCQIRRRPDGSIDMDHYVADGRRARASCFRQVFELLMASHRLGASRHRAALPRTSIVH